MTGNSDVKAGLSECLARLWRYGLVLSKSRDVAEDLVQATCVRALEKADQRISSTRLDRWLLLLLRSIWVKELCILCTHDGMVTWKPSDVGRVAGAEIEPGIYAEEVLKAVFDLPEALREIVLLVYVEGMSYGEVGDFLEEPPSAIMRRLADARLALSRLKMGGVLHTRRQ